MAVSIVYSELSLNNYVLVGFALTNTPEANPSISRAFCNRAFEIEGFVFVLPFLTASQRQGQSIPGFSMGTSGCLATRIDFAGLRVDV